MLLEYLEVDGDLRLCVVSRYRAHEVDLGVTVRDVAESVGKILFGLRRMASSSGRPADPAADMVRQLAARVAATILPDRWLGASEYVVVPTGPLHHLPWAVLAPFAATPFVVAPSAHVWCSIAQRSHGLRRVVVATGPGLPEAEAELRDVKAVWGSRATEVMAASAGDLRAELPGAGIAHVCCHGRFRTDSPQFSALEMADGPFTVFDLEGLDQLPSLMVLSACSLGSVDVRLGNDLLGFPAALFARGVATLVASVLPVEDAATRVLMTEMHASLASGTSPAAALRDARSAVNELGPSHAAAAASFLCFGRG